METSGEHPGHPVSKAALDPEPELRSTDSLTHPFILRKPFYCIRRSLAALNVVHVVRSIALSNAMACLSRLHGVEFFHLSCLAETCPVEG
jgi:hypothetical protein